MINQVRGIFLALAIAATACSGQSVTLGENDAATNPLTDVAAADAAAADAVADAPAADAAIADAPAADAVIADAPVADAVVADAAVADAVAADAAVADASVVDDAASDVPTADLAVADVSSTDVADVGALDVATTLDAAADVSPDAGVVDAPPIPGALTVTLTDNPTGATVTVTGPGFMRTISASTTITDLPPGTYTVTGPSPIAGGLSYVPMFTGVPATVAPGTTAAVGVRYVATDTPPTISAIAPVTLYAGARGTTTIPFTVNDVEDGATTLTPVAMSSAAGVLSSMNAVRTMAGWTINMVPGPAAGTTTVTVTVTDSQGVSTSTMFAVTVTGTAIVTTTADSGPGSLRAVVASVPAGAVVTFAPSVTGTISLRSTLGIARAMTIQGPGASVLTLDGGGTTQLVYVSAPATISGLAFEHGYSGSRGGAIQSPVTTVPLRVEDCTFTSNVADTFGGAIYVLGNLTLVGSTFTLNTAADGGAVHDQGAVNTISNSTFRSNAANGNYGGAIYNYAAGSTTITGCTFASNRARFAGGAVAHVGNGTAMTVTNSTFSLNSATMYGSALMINALSLSASFLTVTGSSGCAAIHGSAGAFTIRNSAIAGNLNGDLSREGHYDSADYNIIQSVAGASFSGQPNDRIGDALAFDPLGNYTGPTPTIRLPRMSPAIDAIPSAACLDVAGVAVATDQRGLPRLAGAGCDIGAFERQSTD